MTTKNVFVTEIIISNFKFRSLIQEYSLHVKLDLGLQELVEKYRW